MKRMPLNKLGPREVSPGTVDFGLYLPWVSAADGHRLRVRIIHEKDQFLQAIQPLDFELGHFLDPDYGDYWSARVAIDPGARPLPHSAWGTPGRYVYRFCLHTPLTPEPIDWIIDPFAREFGVGKLSAFTLGYQPYAWSQEVDGWQTPALENLIVYELMLNEFGGDLDGALSRLDYLADLGINCLEIMPVSNVANEVDWGFLPIGYFGLDERFGKRRDLQRFIDAAHQRGIAVILDMVYGHSSDTFPYSSLYRQLGYHENPVMGPFAKDYFGESTDFNRAFTRDFFFTVNHHWLDCYRVDGFRYDCVPNYWDGATGNGYANLVYETYRTVKETAGAGHWQRFFADGGIRLIQCAEQLEGPVEILEKTYSNCTWQNETLGAARQVAEGDGRALENLGFRLGLSGYPAQADHGADTVPKSALQYLENHDHPRFVCNFGFTERDNDLLKEGDRKLWYKVQPYLIALLTARGIPLLWQGQEFGENYFLPYEGWGRVLLFRPVRWDYFYDAIGKKTLSLVRKLIRLRRERPQFRRGEYYFYNHHDNYLSRHVLLFHRQLGDAFTLVALNFGETEQVVPLAFPVDGNYREELHGMDADDLNLQGITAGEIVWLRVPGNYGRVWTAVGEA